MATVATSCPLCPSGARTHVCSCRQVPYVGPQPRGQPGGAQQRLDGAPEPRWEASCKGEALSVSRSCSPRWSPGGASPEPPQKCQERNSLLSTSSGQGRTSPFRVLTVLGLLPLATSVLEFPPKPENAAGNGGVVSKGENTPLDCHHLPQAWVWDAGRVSGRTGQAVVVTLGGFTL